MDPREETPVTADRPETTDRRWPLWAARILALVGFLDAAYLTASHFAGLGLACGPGGQEIFLLEPDEGARPGMRVH